MSASYIARNQQILILQGQVMTNKMAPLRRFPAFLVLVLAVAAIGNLGVAARASVATTKPILKAITVNLQDKAALRNGALYTLHMCVACHSMQGVRYSSLPQMLGMSGSEFKKIISTNGQHYHDTILSAMPPALINSFVKIVPPDLTVIAKRRSPQWLYTYLTSFYVDSSRPTGANNTVKYNVAMPDVFAPMQGLQKPVVVRGLRFGSPAMVAVGVEPLTKGSMTRAQFDETARDIVDFLYAVAHPHQQERARLGPWIIGLFVALSVLTWLIYKLYWRQVITSERRWWSLGK